MKKIATILILLCLTGNVSAQVFEWIKHEVPDFNLNPSYPEFPVAYDQVNNRVMHARLDSFAFIYGQSVLGKTYLESRDTNGAVIWNFPLGDAAFIQKITVDQVGNIYAGGQFQQTLQIGATDSLPYINVGFPNFNFFLLKFDSQGNLVWKRNMSASWPGYEGIETIAIDPSGVCWYGITDFFTAKIVSVDANGNDVIEHTIDNGKTIGNIRFDPSGGMYISGGCEMGNFIMNADTFNAPYQYNMFIARFDPLGQPSWAYFGNDITFQRPKIATDPSGNVFFAGMRFDSTSFNGFFIPRPQMFGDFFGFKADTSGNVMWAVHQPALLIGPFGIFTTGNNVYVDADAVGNFYMGGTQQGIVDWGNGYISSTTGFSDHKTAIACINPAGSTQWVKIGGSANSNFLHALAVSPGGSSYFTGSFSDTATFDNIVIPNTTFYNFMLGKIRVLPTGVADYNDEAQLTLYPNPANNEIFFSEIVLGKDLQIMDVTGRIVLERKNMNIAGINISSLAPGSYIIRITSTGTYWQARFVKAE